MTMSWNKSLAVRLCVLCGIIATNGIFAASFVYSSLVSSNAVTSSNNQQDSILQQVSAADRSLQQKYYGKDYDKRNEPEKGNPEDCGTDSQGYQRPCHGGGGSDYDNQDGDAQRPSYPLFNNNQGFSPFDPKLRNYVKIDLYVGLKPDAKSIGMRLARVVTSVLNHTMGDCEFFMPSMFDNMDEGDSSSMPWQMPNRDNDEQQQEAKEYGGIRALQNDGGGGGGGNRPPGNGGGWDGGDDEGRTRPTGWGGGDGGNRFGENATDEQGSRRTLFQLYHVGKKPRLLNSTDEYRWWWKHTIKYNIFWRETQEPVMRKNIQRAIRTNITEMIDFAAAQIQVHLADLGHDTGLMFGTDEDVMASPYDPWAMEDGIAAVPPDEDISRQSGLTFTEQLDYEEWDASRYIGLALFLFVTVSGLLVTQGAAIRRRTKLRKQVWSNLASEEGVKQLLSTGWAVKGDRMEVYDKSKVGYTDNDSMLIGGFEQKVALVGSEINIYAGDSIKTRGTRSSKSSGRLRSTESNLASRNFFVAENTSGDRNEEDSQSEAGKGGKSSS